MAAVKPKAKAKKLKAKCAKFKKGNKAAVGNPNSGRPIETDYEEEARLLLKWCKKEDSDHLAQFTIERGTYSTKLWEWRDASTVFSDALKMAKDQLNIKVREKLNNPDKHYDRMLAMRDISNYDILLKFEERDDKKFEADLKIKQDAAAALTLVELNKLSASGELSQK